MDEDEQKFEKMKSLYKEAEQEAAKPSVVLAEFKVTSTELHNLANGKCCKFNDQDSPFSIQFLLKNSFKSQKSNFIINNYVMQIIASEKKVYMVKEEIAVQTRLEKRTTVTKKEVQKPIVKLEIEEGVESLF